MVVASPTRMIMRGPSLTPKITSNLSRVGTPTVTPTWNGYLPWNPQGSSVDGEREAT
jgi:hypothetical protein